MIRNHPERIITATVVTPAPPFGFGSKDEKGTMTNIDGSGGGPVQVPAFFRDAFKNGIVSAFLCYLFHHHLFSNLKIGDREAIRGSIHLMKHASNVIKREEEIITALLSIHYGEKAFPGDSTPSNNWPFSAPGNHYYIFF